MRFSWVSSPNIARVKAGAANATNMTTTTTITANPSRQLIDVNHRITNFESIAVLVSEGGKPFRGLVTSETAIHDPNHVLEYQNCDQNGRLEVYTRRDDGIYQQYYLVVIADEDVKVNINLSTKEIPQMKVFDAAATPIKSKFPWQSVLIVIVFIVAIGLILYFVFTSSKKPRLETSSTSPPPPITKSLPASLPESGPPPAISSSSPPVLNPTITTPTTPFMSLVDKINNIAI